MSAHEKKITKLVLIFYLALLLVTFVAPVLSCPPPLNNFDFIGNATHTSSQLIQSAVAQQGGLGWTEVVSDWLQNPVKRWPRDPDQYTHTISYCYANEDAKNKLSLWISQSISLWLYKIGSPGYDNNHGLQFMIHERFGSPPYCHKDNGSWNDIHPRGSVVIDTMGGHGEGKYALAYASYGYRPEEFDNNPGRHIIRINYDEMKTMPAPAALIAHEWGEW